MNTKKDMTELLTPLYKAGVKETNFHEDDSIVVRFKGKYYKIEEVKLNKDGSIRKA